MHKIRRKPLFLATSTYATSLIIALFISRLLSVDFAYSSESLVPNHVSLDTFFNILITNLKVFCIILTGFFLLKIPTYINLISNGAMLGYFLGGLTSENLLNILPALLVHGIPEVIGFLIAAYLVILGRGKFLDQKKYNVTLLCVGVMIICIAALLETFVSPIFL